MNNLTRKIHLWWLKRRIDYLWKVKAEFSIEGALLVYETLKVYVGDKLWVHPCGALVDEEFNVGEWECSCSMCCSLRELIVEEDGDE